MRNTGRFSQIMGICETDYIWKDREEGYRNLPYQMHIGYFILRKYAECLCNCFRVTKVQLNIHSRYPGEGYLRCFTDNDT